MKQIVDLQKDSFLSQRDVQLVSVGVDSVAKLSYEANRLDIETPLLSDSDKAVSKRYGLPLAWGGKPGHIFVLVGKDGAIKWARDYAIRNQNAVMYVNVAEISQEVSKYLDVPAPP